MRLAEASPGAVRELLADDPTDRPLVGEEWAEVLRAAEFSGARIGEIRQTEDWRSAPMDQQLRVIALKRDEEIVIRWATDDLRDLVGGLTHEHLLCRGDNLESLRSGYVVVTNEDVTVTSTRQDGVRSTPVGPVDSQSRRWLGSLRGRLVVAVIGVTVVVGVVAWRAFLALDETGRANVYEEIVKLSFQFVAIVALGALLKWAIDEERDRRVREDARRALRQGYIRRVIDDSHRVDRAATVIRANRSVKTWTDQMNEEVIPAYIDLRDIRHDLETWAATGQSIFADWSVIWGDIKTMDGILGELIGEYEDNKKNLSELQRRAETAAEPERGAMQASVWDALSHLPHLRDCLGSHGGSYDQFRAAYLHALTAMRDGLAIAGKSV